MSEWMGVLSVAAACVAGASLGMLVSRAKGRAWAAGAAAAMIVIAAVAVARRWSGLEFVPPFSWLMEGRREFAALGPAVTFLFGTLVPKIAARRSRFLVAALAALSAAYMSLLPFVLPVMTRARLAALDNQMDGRVFLQNTPYTCGPAAAVTALAALGISAREGEIAVLARTTRVAGTDADLLRRAVESRYYGEGVRCEYRRFAAVEELDAASPVIVPVRHSLFVGHYVTVLSASGGQVVYADPLVGRLTAGTAEFARMWRGSGIAVKRK